MELVGFFVSFSAIYAGHVKLNDYSMAQILISVKN